MAAHQSILLTYLNIINRITILKGVDCLLKHAQIHSESSEFNNTNVNLEAMKCLANILLLKRDLCASTIQAGAVDGLVRVNHSKQNNFILGFKCMESNAIAI